MKDCHSLTKEVCGAIDHSCCPPCSEHTMGYLNCLLEFSVSSLCPGARCSASATDDDSLGDKPSANSTKPNNATSPGTMMNDTDTPAGGTSNTTTVVNTTAPGEPHNDSCQTVVQDLEECVIMNCAFRNCVSNPGGCKFVCFCDRI